MILASETYAKPVFHAVRAGHFVAVLESYPYATPSFDIRRYPSDGEPLWKVTPEYIVGFTDAMLERADVMSFMIQASQFIDTTNIATVRDTVSRALVHWSKTFPRGVPDCIF